MAYWVFMRLNREARYEDAILRELNTGATSLCFEYEIDGHIWRGTWDGREDGSVFYISLHAWDEPADQRIAPAQRAKLLQRLSDFTPGLILQEQVEGKPVMPALEPGSSYVLEIDGSYTFIRYWEANHLLELPCHRNEENHLVVDVPEQPVWTYPPGQPVGTNNWWQILERVATTPGCERLDRLSTLIDVPEHGTSPGYDRPKHHDKRLLRRLQEHQRQQKRR